MKLHCGPEDVARFAALAEFFELAQEDDETDDFSLRYRNGVLGLYRRNQPNGVWVETAEIRRRLQGDFLLGRACGIHRGAALDILDATAGLGLDALALAVTGQRVTMVERAPVLWALLQDLVERLDMKTASVILGDSAAFLEGLPALTGADRSPMFDVVYFDPMFPARAKSALPGKRMQFLAELLEGAQPFELDLIELARERSRSRVVLKRRLKDPALGQPGWSIKGRAIRYDVYPGRG